MLSIESISVTIQSVQALRGFSLQVEEGSMVGLVGRNHPLAIIPAALLFGALSAGAPAMQAEASVSKEIVLVLQGLVILAVAAFAAANRIPGLRRLATPRMSGGRI